jgi:hypothetical protein
VPFDDVMEVSNHVSALEYGIARLGDGLPLSNRLIREMHENLLSRGRVSERQPGEFRRSQNWIGGTRPGNAHFVPPPLGDRHRGRSFSIGTFAGTRCCPLTPSSPCAPDSSPQNQIAPSFVLANEKLPPSQ